MNDKDAHHMGPSWALRENVNVVEKISTASIIVHFIYYTKSDKELNIAAERNIFDTGLFSCNAPHAFIVQNSRHGHILRCFGATFSIFGMKHHKWLCRQGRASTSKIQMIWSIKSWTALLWQLEKLWWNQKRWCCNLQESDNHECAHGQQHSNANTIFK